MNNKKIEFRPKSFPQKKIWGNFEFFLTSVFEKIFLIFAKTDFYIKGKKQKMKTNSGKINFPKKITSRKKFPQFF